jgi:hypothetical protein
MKRAPKKFFPEKLATGGRKNKCNDKSKAIQAKMQSEQHLSRRQRALCHWKKGTFENLGGLGPPAPPPGSYAPGDIMTDPPDFIVPIHLINLSGIQLFQLRLSTSKAEKSNTSAKGCWESLKI